MPHGVRFVGESDVGQQYGWLTVVGHPFRSHTESGYVRTFAVCLCRCSRYHLVDLGALRYGIVRSCGCYQKTEGRRVTHGDGNKASPYYRLYAQWCDMKTRCRRSPYYTSKGIRVCKEWRGSYAAFKEHALTHGWRPGLSVERIDCYADYRPSNVTFVPLSKQSSNTSANRRFTAFGETKLLIEWARDPRCVPTFSGLRYRIDKLGWEMERAMTTPLLERKPACVRPS